MQNKPFLLQGMQWDHLNVSELKESRREEKLVVGIKLDLQTIYI